MRSFGFGVRDLARRRRVVRAAPTPAAPVLLAILAGQSNMEGRQTPAGYDGANATYRQAQDTDVAHAFQFVGYDQSPDYRRISADITPLLHYKGFADGSAPADRVGPGEYVARALLADNAGADVVLVPVAQGTTALVAAPAQWKSGASAGSGGVLFENMVTQANLAYAAAQARFSGRPILVRFFFVQGEQDAAGGIGKAAYLAALTDFVTHARARVTGAAEAPFVIGSMIPQKWAIGSPNYLASYAAINAAQVAASLAIAGVRYVRGPAGSGDNLHYSEQAVTRAQGVGLAAALSYAAGPSVTTAGAQGATAGNPLNATLAADDPHATFHIAGGTDAALFEVSDPYLTPTLRWAGNGTGPAAGSYRVDVRARDGAGNYGPDRPITATVANPYGIGDQGPVTATHMYAAAITGAAYSPYRIDAVPLKAGLNLVLYRADGNHGALSGVSVNGIAATKMLGVAGFEVWGAVVPADTAAGFVTASWAGASPMGGRHVAVLAMTGTRAAPTTTDLLGWAFRASPHAGASLAVPTRGVLVGLGAAAGLSGAGAGTTVLGSAGIVFTASRGDTGALSVTGAGGYSGIASLVFEKSA